MTLIEPGYVRTNFLNSSSLITAVNPIDDYTADDYGFANYKIDPLKNEIELNKELTFSTDFPS